MITILFHMTVKAGLEEKVAATAKELMVSTRAYDGCLSYTFYRRTDRPHEFVLFEQWRDADALGAHLARLQQIFGPPEAGSRLPRTFLDMFEKTEAVRYASLK